MGILLALGATAFFGLQQALVRIGMHARPRDDGLFMSVLLNTLLLGLVMIPLSLPSWSWSGVLAFLAAGLLTTWAGRRASFKAIRRIGPARTSTFLMSGPVFAAMVGWVLLDEKVHLVDLLGGLVITIGLVMLIRSRASAESLVVPEEEARMQAGSRSWSRRGDASARRDSVTVRGFAYGILGAFFFGVGFVVRKWALLHYSSAVAGAFFGAVAALMAIVVTATHRRDLGPLVEDNFRSIPWPFVIAGLASSAALVMQFAAFYFLPAWIVSLFQGSQGLWMLVWSPLLLGEEEHLTPHVVAAILLVATGAGIIAAHS